MVVSLEGAVLETAGRGEALRHRSPVLETVKEVELLMVVVVG